MGRNYVRFRCHHCNHCCTEVICLPTPHDVRRIVAETGANPCAFLEFVTPDEISEVADDDPTWLEVGGERYLMALRRDRHGCYFLSRKTRFCTIYESRPLLCRLYPFLAEEDRDGNVTGFGLHKDVGCPRHRDGLVPVAPLRESFGEDQAHQADYRALVRTFNARSYRGKKPAHFLDLVLEASDAERRQWKRRAAGADRTWHAR